MILPSAIEFVEVGPRDGLQNEPVILATNDKLSLIERLIDAGARRIEVASFVNPRRVPQMADAEDVCAGLPRRGDVTYVGLVLNLRGAERALATGRIDQLGAVAVATDSFAMANQGQTCAGSVAAACDIVALANRGGASGQVTIAAAFGCPYEGEVDPSHVVEIARTLAQSGPAEIALADTIGVADPWRVTELVRRVSDAVAPLPVRVHFHNTRGTGLANVWAAVAAGATIVDASVGGLGGCPFALGAAGNVCSEDVVYMLERAGIATGMRIDALIATSQWLGSLIDKQLPGMAARAPAFPPGA
ncbi:MULTISPECIES: hydroxymethylglutaryl-CoA lyase [unclassified Sphingopyxis]|uniref:hydroxymethylglutaryl-CoA lyase n=1 Tax=unclassified Sphingopyxis TaxID=2614943 RepID=UPI00072FE31A|nr:MULTISPECIES: hydroxymethylglutaryl-CoA lyase [unclassified Sphingopyxis]KTE26631.1 3-hydroxy-3-methylglutaryl-CoA lyase [Sphingopyxis sp. H057]KTE53037.1 3-hydroxy-3-methylglutaryl-CoA lyase [Sphingopyxis sp. H073]KTE55304.1 3-hydroxy-3-methylglutaryl-CoA lyase [Sphingopyxis sp. H071]KTE58716.1 3-hydroxy-3-methylglutaryl-CoA lyase [Sphingopyxis sp. H107]KTE61312.1 3-hydroxy-3-methylglutaryl-CoA lyase [Sphingopyxis sp. H100]